MGEAALYVRGRGLGPGGGALFAGWAIIPVSWMKELAHLNISNFVSIAFIAIPILVSGFAYLWGAMKEKRVKLAEAERLEKVAEVGKKSQK